MVITRLADKQPKTELFNAAKLPALCPVRYYFQGSGMTLPITSRAKKPRVPPRQASVMAISRALWFDLPASSSQFAPRVGVVPESLRTALVEPYRMIIICALVLPASCLVGANGFLASAPRLLQIASSKTKREQPHFHIV
ncbi:hypothetical protein RJZ57_003908, partial [Blastomyces gilchristii]